MADAGNKSLGEGIACEQLGSRNSGSNREEDKVKKAKATLKPEFSYRQD
ncbi:25341_t:CDS:2 [Dentiscutata erythropus]|uniref:25341_t:CDS:1 n=1 Tax=Dentiscutata erythropus TaxID=1348616 RepID=A0A9N9EN43_9GLOM|nr:25341_t:CDS:2 [Dentiscutata erythropus]